MSAKSTFAVSALFFLFLGNTFSQQGSRTFADRMLVGVHFGYLRDYNKGLNQDESQYYWSPRVGVSLRKRLYVGLRAQLIRARNIETDWQTFYTAGLWLRGYVRKPVLNDLPRRWNFFWETGLLESNFAFNYKDFVTYFYSKSGQWYLPFSLGAECRLIKNLTLEGGVQLHYNIGKSWDLHGFGYLSLGLNWHFL